MNGNHVFKSSLIGSAAPSAWRYWADRITLHVQEALQERNIPNDTLQRRWRRWCNRLEQKPIYRMEVQAAAWASKYGVNYSRPAAAEIGEWVAFGCPDADSELLSHLKAWTVWVFAFDDFLEHLVMHGDDRILMEQESQVAAALGESAGLRVPNEGAEALIRMGCDLISVLTDYAQKQGATNEQIEVFLQGYKSAHWEFLVSAPQLRRLIIGQFGTQIPLPIYLFLRALDAGCPTPLSLIPLFTQQYQTPESIPELKQLHILAAIHFLLANDIQSFVREISTEKAPFNALFVAMRVTGIQSADKMPHALAGLLMTMDEVFTEAHQIVTGMPKKHQIYGRAVLLQLLGNTQHTLWCERYLAPRAWYSVAGQDALTRLTKLLTEFEPSIVPQISLVGDERPEWRTCQELLPPSRVAS